VSANSRAREIAATVTDPELPMLTLEDLGVLRDVQTDATGRVVVALTPTYSGCPALATMRDDLVHRLQANGFPAVSVKVQLSPAWTTDWITDRGRQALRRHGISVPGPAPRAPLSVTLAPTRRRLSCPQCGSSDTTSISEFGSSACKALYRCQACLEPFEHVKEI
jgi:ring-1,2-phenylacetyl-CoA epoxidase subunit PaaD